MLHRHSTEPTERSMPPVMITIVIPSAMIATKVKLRATLEMLFEVANELVANDRKMQARMTATETQKACREFSQGSSENLARLIVASNCISIHETVGYREARDASVFVGDDV